MAPPGLATQVTVVVAANGISQSRKQSLDRLIESREKSNFHDPEQVYYPKHNTRQLITTTSIEKEFKKSKKAFSFLEDDDEDDNKAFYQQFENYHQKDAQEALAQWVSNKAHKTFATAYVSGLSPLDLLAYMVTFKNAGFTDKNLPSNAVQRATLDFGMSPARAQDFCDQRWKFLAPVFKPQKYDYNLSSSCIFPFTKDATMSRKGAFGMVSKVKVHSEHQRHPNMQYVAIKEIELLKGNDMHATNSAWEDEARALRNINKLEHPHITKCIAAIRRGDRRYFMFPWAEGGNLQEFWERISHQSPNPQLVRQAIIQLRGLADALDTLHNCDSGSKELLAVPGNDSAGNEKSIRHGDLKPENILRFFTQEEMKFVNLDQDLGNLRIADMGLAKQHVDATALRKNNTSQRYGTIRYEAPEAIKGNGGRSRLYDIWSMGCIALEFVIWLLYGNEAVKEFHLQVGGDTKQACQYFECEDGSIPEVHHVVSEWMDHIHQTDPECSEESALRDLLNLIRSRLLVVALDSSSVKRKDSVYSRSDASDTALRFRATAKEFRGRLNDILEKTKVSTYLCTGKSRQGVELPVKKDRSSATEVHPNDNTVIRNARSTQVQTSIGVTGRSSRTEYSLPPLRDWEFPVDNTFAEQVQAIVGFSIPSPSNNRRARLCKRCADLDFWVGGFSLEDTAANLEHCAKYCDFCNMLQDACKREKSVRGSQIQLDRVESNLKLANAELPTLSIRRSPELITQTPIQLGSPILPEPGTDAFFGLIKLWLEDCDTAHIDCKPQSEAKSYGKAPRGLPTRLIDVGTLANFQLRLVETQEEVTSSTDYVALSHPWGDTSKYAPFSTLRRDDSGAGRDIDTFKKAMPYHELPATFKDAVDCTRALGIQYLWVDSICIIQGKDGDFTQEAKNMENVFSGAYCVLAASRATNQHDGFLGPRPQRKYITFQRGDEDPFYICESIDNFSKDVIEGSLNQRGWVLQERALARRTIYFTENQTYFECGKGIRCETLGHMHNTMADFIGDPRFPEKAMRSSSRALKIEYYQDLYKLYSRLQFSRYEDRPFAIAGLEKRLRQAFGTKGGYGVFDDGDKRQRGLFHRSILWQRGADKEFEDGLVPIEFPADRKINVPSWSWMAYRGGIDYTDPPGGTVVWETDEISEPWTHGFGKTTGSAPEDGTIAIPAIVRDFAVANRLANEVKLTYDTGRTKGSDGQRAQCVIVARERGGRSSNQKRHYVLLVAPKQATTGRGRKVYERIGAGYILGKYISLDDAGIKAEIQ